MGKYMRKSKGTGGVSLMDVSHTQPSLGVRTRAKTLALQRLQNSSSSAAAGGGGRGGGAGGSYLQLRSRRLEKVSPIVLDGKRKTNSQKDVNLEQKSSGSRLNLKGDEEKKEEEEKVKVDGGKGEEEDMKSRGSGDGGDLRIEETSFGENMLESEGRERATRESTPCSLIRDPDTIKTPGSSTRPSPRGESQNREILVVRQIPTAEEVEEFFSGAEAEQQRKFVDKYNFDFVTDKPLPGRYEWEILKD